MPNPIVLLVHGAFADGSSWARVIEQLQTANLDARAVANPLRGLTYDGEYVASVVGQTEGDVVLVGHSYGGPVITYAGSKAENVKALVYVASFGLDEGVSALESVAGFPEADLGGALDVKVFPTEAGPAPEAYIQRDRYHAVFAADLSADEAAVAAVSQRPAAIAALTDKLAVPPAWRRVPSWFAVATADHAIDPSSQRAAAERLGATTVEIEGSHSIALSRPAEVAAVILEAVRGAAG